MDDGARKEPPIQAYMLDHMNELRAQSDAERAAKAQTAITQQRLRALGLASGDPDHLEEYAIAAAIPPDTLLAALDTEDGAKLGIAMETHLRNSGELAHVAFARMLYKAVLAVDKGLDDGSVPAAAASKIIDEYGKFRERAIEASKTSAMEAPVPFTGSAEQLVAELLGSHKPIRELWRVGSR